MSIIQVTGGSGGGVPADRTLFIGPRIPQEVKTMGKHLDKIDKQTFRKLLQVAVSSLEGSTVDSSQFKGIQPDSLTDEIFSFLYSGLYVILESALRIPQSTLKKEIFHEDLKDLKIPGEFIPDIVNVVFGSRRGLIDQRSIESRCSLPKLKDFSWRVDVGLSSSHLHRVLEATILSQVTLSDGAVKTFEIPVSKFHELRYSVAHVLKEMHSLEERKILEQIKDQ